MDFQEAVSALKDGKKIRRQKYRKDLYLQLSDVDNTLMGFYTSSEVQRFDGDDISADDWEIVE